MYYWINEGRVTGEWFSYFSFDWFCGMIDYMDAFAYCHSAREQQTESQTWLLDWINEGRVTGEWFNYFSFDWFYGMIVELRKGEKNTPRVYSKAVVFVAEGEHPNLKPRMGIFPARARRAVFIKAGLRVWSKNHDFQSSRPLVSEGLLKKWGFFRRERRFSLRQGLGFGAKIMIFQSSRPLVSEGLLKNGDFLGAKIGFH